MLKSTQVIAISFSNNINPKLAILLPPIFFNYEKIYCFDHISTTDNYYISHTVIMPQL